MSRLHLCSPCSFGTRGRRGEGERGRKTIFKSPLQHKRKDRIQESETRNQEKAENHSFVQTIMEVEGFALLFYSDSRFLIPDFSKIARSI
jgi:hypothetical protein